MNIKELKDVQHYTGGEKCSYVDCDDIAEFVVQGVDGTKTYTFVGCEECLNDAKIYPLENEWVDERTDKRRNA